MSVIKTSQLILYKEIINVCSQIHTKHINTLCGQNVELLNVNLGSSQTLTICSLNVSTFLSKCKNLTKYFTDTLT